MTTVLACLCVYSITRSVLHHGRSARSLGYVPGQRAGCEDVPVVVAAVVFARASYAGAGIVLRLLDHREGQRCGAAHGQQAGTPLGRHRLVPASHTDLGRLLLQGNAIYVEIYAVVGFVFVFVEFVFRSQQPEAHCFKCERPTCAKAVPYSGDTF